jgi:hypothetical protein
MNESQLDTALVVFFICFLLHLPKQVRKMWRRPGNQFVTGRMMTACHHRHHYCPDCHHPPSHARFVLSSTTTKAAYPPPVLFSATPSWFSSTSIGGGGVGRSRKRRRSKPVVGERPTPSSSAGSANHEKPRKNRCESAAVETTTDGAANTILSYPKGQPWRVLWPNPNGDIAANSSSSAPRRHIPRIKDIRRAWKLYKETWEDGLSGRPSKKKMEQIEKMQHPDEYNASKGEDATAATDRREKLKDIGDNASRNLRLVRRDAQYLLEQAKERTGIRSQEDVKALASEMMQIATECIKEFMAGYRQGRDQEIDKMLHEYFKDEDQVKHEQSKKADPSTPQDGPKSRRKRKPKRGIPRS